MMNGLNGLSGLNGLNGETLFDVIGEIDEGFVAQAHAYRHMRGKLSRRGAFAAVACLLCRNVKYCYYYARYFGPYVPVVCLMFGYALRRTSGKTVAAAMLAGALAMAPFDGVLLLQRDDTFCSFRAVEEIAGTVDGDDAAVVFSVKNDAPLVDGPDARDGVEHGGLSRAVSADDGDEITGIQMERELVQRAFLVDGAGVEGLADLEQVKHGSSPPSV